MQAIQLLTRLSSIVGERWLVGPWMLLKKGFALKPKHVALVEERPGGT